MNIRTTLLAGGLFLTSLAFAQPANDDKADATTLTSKINCTPGYANYYEFDLKEAEISGGEKDIWYKFVSTSKQYNLEYGYDFEVKYEIMTEDNEATVDYNGTTFSVSKIDTKYYIRFYAAEEQLMSLNQKFCFEAFPGNWSKEEAKEVTHESAGDPVSNAFNGAYNTEAEFTCNTDEDATEDIWYKFTAESDAYDVTTQINSSMSYYFEILDEDGMSLHCGTGGKNKTTSITTEMGKTYYLFAGKMYSSADFSFGVSIDPTGTVLNASTSATQLVEYGLSVTPNPAREIVAVSGAEGEKYIITDSNGKLALSGSVMSGQINVSSLSAGIYTLCIGEETGKIVVVK